MKWGVGLSLSIASEGGLRGKKNAMDTVSAVCASPVCKASCLSHTVELQDSSLNESLYKGTFMGYKLIVSKDEQVLKEYALISEHTYIGRRPHNDVTLEDQTVSGKHAVVVCKDDVVTVEDLGSTNGTYVNGDPIKSKELHLGDRIVIGPYRVTLQLQMSDVWNHELAPQTGVSGFQETFKGRESQFGAHVQAYLELVSGPAKGGNLALTKVVTTIGAPGVAVIAMTQRLGAYALSKVEGDSGVVLCNGQPVDDEVILLNSGDVIDLADVSMVFRMESVSKPAENMPV